MSGRTTRCLAPLLLAALLAACGTSAAGPDGRTTSLRVFAAASLGSVFEQLGQQFEAAHDGVDVELSLAGSADLVAQVQHGAPADVVATADEGTLGRLVLDGLVESPQAFATNTLQLAVPPDNPAGVGTLRDLARPGISLVVCAPQVPCGAAARTAAEGAGVTLRPVSEEQSVTDVLNKVRSGEADAGLVYATDVRRAGEAVVGIPLPEAADVVNVYAIASVAGSGRAELADAFVELAVGPAGRALLAGAGFGAP